MKLAPFVLIVALDLALVLAREGFGPGEQEWGHVTVRPNAHMFFWLYYTTANVTCVTDRPLVIWLQGGPGASSTGYGNFEEIGPLDIDLKPRNFTWVKDVNLLFIDNPVGTGFSYVDKLSALPDTNQQVGKDLVEFMGGFYEKLPQFKNVSLYIVSESYGGKMAIEFALQLDQAIKSRKIETVFKGVALGNSWISPMDTVNNWAPFLYNIGAVDKDGFYAVDRSVKEIQKAMDEKKYVLATLKWANAEVVIWNLTYGVDFYNVLEEVQLSTLAVVSNSTRTIIGDSIKAIAQPAALRDIEEEKLEQLMNSRIKEALNLTTVWGHQNKAVFKILSGDFMKPVTETVELVLNTTDIKVMVYSGQLDLIVCTPGTVEWVDKLNWIRKAEYKKRPRRPLLIDGYIEGYGKSVKNFDFFWINRAGHMVPPDNPKAMDAILRRLTNHYSSK